MVDVFSGFGIPTGIYFVVIPADICLIFLLLICAIFDLVTMIMLKRNHCGRKVMEIREKKIFQDSSYIMCLFSNSSAYMHVII